MCAFTQPFEDLNRAKKNDWLQFPYFVALEPLAPRANLVVLGMKRRSTASSRTVANAELACRPGHIARGHAIT